MDDAKDLFLDGYLAGQNDANVRATALLHAMAYSHLLPADEVLLIAKSFDSFLRGETSNG